MVVVVVVVIVVVVGVEVVVIDVVVVGFTQSLLFFYFSGRYRSSSSSGRVNLFSCGFGLGANGEPVELTISLKGSGVSPLLNMLPQGTGDI